MELPYLFRLAARLSEGLTDLDAARGSQHRRFVLSREQPDGGFAGREEGSDLYYTSFALRGLSLLDGLEPALLDRLANYLRSCRQQQAGVIDVVSWLYSALVVLAAGGPDLPSEHQQHWEDRLADVLESFRTADGGYAKTREGAVGSTYHSFLVALCYELIDRPLPQPNRLVQFLFDRQRDDGGFVEIAPMKRGGTNPTAAAVALLNMFGGMDPEIREDVREFLGAVRSEEGGFGANSRIPFADGLSTFTGLLTAQDLGLDDLLPPDRIRDFIRSLEFPGGGFRGASWDEAADVEYTFYALGVLGLLGSE